MTRLAYVHQAPYPLVFCRRRRNDGPAVDAVQLSPPVLGSFSEVAATRDVTGDKAQRRTLQRAGPGSVDSQTPSFASLEGFKADLRGCLLLADFCLSEGAPQCDPMRTKRFPDSRRCRTSQERRFNALIKSNREAAVA